MELAISLEKMVRDFSRYNKYAIGADLRTISKRVVTLVIRANSSRDKTNVLTELRDRCEEMKMTIMIGKEIKAFKNFKDFEKAATLSVEISRQSEGWLRSVKRESK